jgi:hypothetical protein
MADSRLRLGPLLAVVLAVVGLVLWGCIGDLPCGEEDCAPYVAPVWTRAVAAERTLVVVETVVDDLGRACAALWDSCCVPLTATAGAPVATAQPQATYTPVATYTPRPTYTAQATYTPRASATAEPFFCKRCIVDDPVYGCPGSYVCEACAECYFLCVPAESPRAGCNFCAGIVIP